MITIAVTELNGKTCCTGLGCLGKPVQNYAQKRRSENQLHDGFQHDGHSVSYRNCFQGIFENGIFHGIQSYVKHKSCM